MDKIGSASKKLKAHAERDLDCTNAERGVWLVKVPKYMSARWQNAPPLSEAGRLRITKVPGTKTDIKFTLADEPFPAPGNKTDIPKEHQFVISSISNQTLAVFSQNGVAESGSSQNISEPSSSKMILEGHVFQKCECRPLANQKYMNLKRISILKASEPERKVQQLKKVAQTFKPVSDHKHNIEFELKKKVEGKKARDDKEKVMDMLFAAFEKHQYYNIKDLEKITKQPVTYLKEILKEICNYNAKNPHKSMWELKPEYRCYKEQEPPAI